MDRIYCMFFTGELLRAAFGDWELIRLEAYERDLDEGEGHRGLSAVIDLVARRPPVAAHDHGIEGTGS